MGADISNDILDDSDDRRLGLLAPPNPFASIGSMSSDEPLDDSADRRLALVAPPSAIPPQSEHAAQDDMTPSGSIEATVPVPIAPLRQIATMGAPKVAPPAAAPGVADYIGNRLAQSQSDLKDAQSKASKNRGIANLTEGLGQISAGLAHSDTFNPSSYKYLHEGAEQPVTDYLESQKAKQADLSELSGEQKYKQTALYNEPNSVPSKIAQNLTGKMLAKQGIDPNSVQGMSAADLAELEKTLKDVNDRDSMEKIINLKQQQLKLARDAKTDTKNQQDELAQLKALQGNKTYQTFRDQSERADGLLNHIQLATTDPAAANALTTELGTFISGGQRLHNKTMEDMGGGEKDIKGKLFQISQTARTGTITEANANYLSKFIKAQFADAKAGMERMQKQVANDYKNETGRTPKWYKPSQSQSTSPLAYSDPDKEARYQKWKQSQGTGNTQ